ncbi:hypothetical protein HK107_11475 [Parvularcula sp. ZS-1/3]|uniref:Uncharacterized protein n=1 Tax=Parvularcula mediterranea TaxID=2732508 RepID=A0A7Y3RMV5_9PROT|nr:hypothetical protein [Parvularcula mediterranea]NNU16939.1 hypothetical protein [Parvularcula mediterranea]
MSSLAQRKYVFRRRPIWGRVALVVVGAAFALWAFSAKSDAKAGGFQRMISIEEPAR